MHIGRPPERYDVVIIGSGPAGCSVAYHITKSFNVLLCDNAGLSREKPCGGLLTDRSQQFLKNIGGISDELFSHPSFLDVKYVDWNTNQEKMEKVKLWNVWRNRLDEWLLKKIRCEVWGESCFLRFIENEEEIKIMLRRKKENIIIKTTFLIGGDGTSSLIRNQTYQNSFIRRYITFQEWIKCDRDLNDMVYLIYDNNISDVPSWVIPKNEFVLIGSAFKKISIKKIGILRRVLLKRLRIEGKSVKKQFHLICRPKSIDEILFGRGHIILVGEAAGLINPGNGDGISFALRSGFNCAQALNIDWENPLSQYSLLCNPLLREIEEGLRWADIISDPSKRLERFFKSR